MKLQNHDLTLPSVRLHYLQTAPTTNGAPTLVFLHYFGGSSRTWLPVIEELVSAATSNYHCVSLDLRGSGDSRVETNIADSTVAYSLDAMAGDVVALLATLGLKRYSLVGHSMGGKVALAAATAYGCPPGLESLMLVAPSPPSPEPMPDTERARLLAAHGSATAARETLTKITAHPLPPTLAHETVADQLRVAPTAWRAWLEYGSRQDITARLPRLRVPVFLAAGEKDANITPRLLRREVADRLPATLAHDPITIPDAAHLLPLESPQAIADFIRRMLAT